MWNTGRRNSHIVTEENFQLRIGNYELALYPETSTQIVQGDRITNNPLGFMGCVVGIQI